MAEFAPQNVSNANDANHLDPSTTVTTEASGVIPIATATVHHGHDNSQAALIANINSTAAAITQLGQKAEYNSWETPQVFTSQGGSNTPIQRERPDNVKAVWADPCICPYGAPEEVCGSRVGEHSDFFRWSVHFPGFESYSVGDFVVLNSHDSNYSLRVAKILALWRCNSSRRNYASVLRYENAYTVLPEGDPRELLLALNRDPEKVELRLLKKLVRVLDLTGQSLPQQINLTDFDFYTYRFINTDGKTTTTQVPENLVIPKKIPDLSEKAKISRRRRESGPRKRKTEDPNNPMTPDENKKKRAVKTRSVEELTTSPITETLTVNDVNVTPVTYATTASVLDIVQLISQCEETPEDAAALLGDLPFNKLKVTKKFLVSLLKVLDQMNIPVDNNGLTDDTLHL